MKKLREVIAEVQDFRKRQGKRYELGSILSLAIVAIMCGLKSYCAIAQWGRESGVAITAQLGFKEGKTPCAATIHRVFKHIDIKELEEKVGEWQRQQLGTVAGELAGFAADGKSLRGSTKQGAEVSHLLSIVSHKLGVTIRQQQIETKTNEIPVLQQMLRQLDLSGMVLTVDALHTQVETAQVITDQGGDYLMIAKGNQKQLFDDIETAFQLISPATPLAQAETTDMGHGRIETRRLTTTTLLTDYLAWPANAQVFCLERDTYFKKTGHTRHQLVYGITSLSPERASASMLLALVRGHWTVENRSHWVRDVTFDEDRSQVRVGNIPQVMAFLRNTAISLMRLAGFTNIAPSSRSFASRPSLSLAILGLADN
jgi:predicted transposase YbfD/YdcC